MSIPIDFAIYDSGGQLAAMVEVKSKPPHVASLGLGVTPEFVAARRQIPANLLPDRNSGSYLYVEERQFEPWDC